jgi:hypothetical protein
MKIFTLTTPYLKNNTRKLLIVPHLYSDSSIQCSRSNTTAVLNVPHLYSNGSIQCSRSDTTSQKEANGCSTIAQKDSDNKLMACAKVCKLAPLHSPKRQ